MSNSRGLTLLLTAFVACVPALATAANTARQAPDTGATKSNEQSAVERDSRASSSAAFTFSFFDTQPTRSIRGLRLNLPYGSHNSVHGLDIGIANHLAGDMHGLQFSIGGYVDGDMHGVQYNSLLSMVDGKAHGWQHALVSSAGELHGVQTSFVNLSDDNSEGAQVGVINISRSHLLGAELGLINYSRSVEGLQFGLVNVTGQLRGIQIGLINIASNGFLPFFPVFNAAL